VNVASTNLIIISLISELCRGMWACWENCIRVNWPDEATLLFEHMSSTASVVIRLRSVIHRYQHCADFPMYVNANVEYRHGKPNLGNVIIIAHRWQMPTCQTVDILVGAPQLAPTGPDIRQIKIGKVLPKV
jgi:hypothetical protein